MKAKRILAACALGCALLGAPCAAHAVRVNFGPAGHVHSVDVPESVQAAQLQGCTMLSKNGAGVMFLSAGPLGPGGAKAEAEALAARTPGAGSIAQASGGGFAFVAETASGKPVAAIVAPDGASFVEAVFDASLPEAEQIVSTLRREGEGAAQ